MDMKKGQSIPLNRPNEKKNPSKIKKIYRKNNVNIFSVKIIYLYEHIHFLLIKQQFIEDYEETFVFPTQAYL
jgi:hypothetical protein